MCGPKHLPGNGNDLWIHHVAVEQEEAYPLHGPSRPGAADATEGPEDRSQAGSLGRHALPRGLGMVGAIAHSPAQEVKLSFRLCGRTDFIVQVLQAS